MVLPWGIEVGIFSTSKEWKIIIALSRTIIDFKDFGMKYSESLF